jgi:hypothetical protein
MRLKTQFWSKDHRVISDKYRNGYDLIKWNKESPSKRAKTTPVSGEKRDTSEKGEKGKK